MLSSINNGIDWEKSDINIPLLKGPDTLDRGFNLPSAKGKKKYCEIKAPFVIQNLKVFFMISLILFSKKFLFF